jgi:prepilin-type N-terminal cleavage/methylation domain-containing protein
MNTLHLQPSHSAEGQRAGFSLIELLTAMAVLALILVMLMQVVNGILQSTQTQSQQIESVETARRMLDIIETDLSLAVVGENAAVLVKSDADSHGLALLSDRRGPVDPHRFLAVRYDLDDATQLSRSYGSVGFTDTDLLGSTVNTPNTSILSDGILAFQIRVNTGNGSYSATDTASVNWATNNYNGGSTPTGWKALITESPAFASGLSNRAKAIQIWVAAVDSQNLSLIDTNSIGAIFGPDPTSWRAAVDSAADLPPRVKAGIRILNKTVPLP